MGQAMVPITLGALLGAAVAVAPSGVFPTGFVRVIEPSPGLLVDWKSSRAVPSCSSWRCSSDTGLDSAVFRVSGLVVMPGFGSNDGLGVGGVVTTSGLARIDDAAPPTILAVQLSSSVAEFATSVPELGDVPPDSTYVPAAIVNVSRIRAIPFALWRCSLR